MRQVKLKQVKLKIETSFSENRGAAIAVEYLNSGEITLRDGLEVALSCLFAPLGAAAKGASQSEVKSRREISRTIFETYMNLAMSRAEVNETEKSCTTEVEAHVTRGDTKFEDSTPTVTHPLDSKREGEESSVLGLFKSESAMTSSRDNESSNAVSGINFDDEEF